MSHGASGGPGTSHAAPAGGDVRLVLPDAVGDRLARALERAYPKEGCGVLLGRVDGPDRRVGTVHEAENRWPERADRADRYLVAPGTLRKLMDREAAGGPAVLGFYHSHPDAGAVPSRTDREHAWPWYVYLVVSVARGVAGEARAWQLDRETGDFVERSVVRPPGGERSPDGR